MLFGAKRQGFFYLAPLFVSLLAVASEASTCASVIRAYEEVLVNPDLPAHISLNHMAEYEAFNLDAIEALSENTEAAFNKLQSKWSLSDEELATTKAYYRLLRQENAASYDSSEDLRHLSDLGRKRFFKENPAAKKRYDYYAANIAKKSIPEIARELGISENRVRRELSDFSLSVVDAFKGDFGDGTTQASAFVRHHQHIEDRRVTWKRVAKFEGKRLREDEILKILHERSLSSQQIAQKLNELFGTTQSDANYRSEGSINEQKRFMGLLKSREIAVKNIEIEPYGKLKTNGQLEVAGASRFIFDHREKGMAWIAEQLAVNESTIHAFAKRHHLLGLFKRDLEKEVQVARKGLLDTSLEHLIRKGELIGSNDAEAWTAAYGVGPDKALGWGAYSESGYQNRYALFSGSADYYASLEQHLIMRVESEKSLEKDKDRLLGVIRKQRGNSALSKLAFEDKQELVLRNLLDHLLKDENGSIPSSANKKAFSAVAGVEYDKWTGQGYYKDLNPENPNRGLHSDAEDAFSALLSYAEDNFDALGASAKKRTDIVAYLEGRIEFHKKAKMNSQEKVELAYDDLYKHLLQNEEFPSSKQSEWSKAVSFSYSNFTKEFHKSPASAFRSFERWLKNKLKTDTSVEAQKAQRLLEVSERKAFEFEFESYPFSKQQELATERVVSAFISLGAFPKNTELKKLTGILDRRFYGIADYSGGSGLHLNPESAFASLEKELELQMTQKRFRVSQKQNLRRLLQEAKQRRGL